jgi:hypothetical protein
LQLSSLSPLPEVIETACSGIGKAFNAMNCMQAVVRSWRIIIGIGAAPALIAVLFRRSIPESPMFTADVLNQPEGGLADMNRLAGIDSSVAFGESQQSE